ncbi:CAP domain-containing protein [Lutibacter sp.]|uniref:CAP domain-containing protein n=1 Tax=Lutibacter sp. TaxID=1925666 RepID=UPI002735D900|nr:CAP domain-containing protein [Lutibacter sp.]MDP3312669.1 CAP domain-containing protein [Lutibacter sp.]
MKPFTPKLALFVFVSILLTSCAPEDDGIYFEKINETKQTYSNIELDIFELINNYRASKGLNRLEVLNIISSVALTHTSYMVSTGKVSHDNFASRNENLVENAKAISVGENVAYGFSSAEGVVNAWLNSEGHRKIIENENYTHFGISTEKNDKDRNYFTQMFIQK